MPKKTLNTVPDNTPGSPHPHEVSIEEALKRYFRSAKFETSASKLSQCPSDTGREIAFAGRSNAGKSSAINCLTDNKKLARTSKTPGRTQLINFFTLEDGARLVDLPGYGFAKVGLAKKHEWQKLMEAYLENRRSLAGLVLLIDSRRPFQPIDEVMLSWTVQYDMPCHILLTKADKLSKNQASKVLLATQKQLKSIPNANAQLFSALTHIGLHEARTTIDQKLSTTTE